METTNDNQNFDIMSILDDLNTIEGNALNNNANQNSLDDVAVAMVSNTNQSITTSSDIDVEMNDFNIEYLNEIQPYKCKQSINTNMETTNDNQNFDIMSIPDDINTIKGNALNDNVNQNSWDDVAVATASSTNQSITTSSDIDVEMNDFDIEYLNEIQPYKCKQSINTNMETTNDNQNFDIMSIPDDINTIKGNALNNNANQNSWDDVAVATASSTNQSITTSSDIDIDLLNDSSIDLSSIAFNQLYHTTDFIDDLLYIDFESSDLVAEQNQDKLLDVIISKCKYKSAKSDFTQAGVDIQTCCVGFETVDVLNNLSKILGFEPQSSLASRDECNYNCSTSKLSVLSIDEHCSRPNTSQGSLKLTDTSVSPQLKRPVLDLLKKKLFLNGMKTRIIHCDDPVLKNHLPINQKEVAWSLQKIPCLKDLVKYHGVSNTFTWITRLCNIHYYKFINIYSSSQRIKHVLLNLRKNVKPKYSQCCFCQCSKNFSLEKFFRIE